MSNLLRVAVIGAGPAGIYAAEALTAQDAVPVAVDVYDALPTPFGLLRYGVAPDHIKMKSLATTLQRTLDHDAVGFVGNVRVGDDVTVEELLNDYHAVIFSFGAALDRRLGIPGEDLIGSMPATDFVAWYSGHPDTATDAVLLTATSAVVIGLGNVALDVARVLARNAEEFSTTDVPHHVLDVLRASPITDVHIVGRRGPEHAKFTIKELREMGELDGVDVFVDPADVADVAEPEDKAARRNVEVFREWATRAPKGVSRRLYMHFHSRPAEILGEADVTGLRVERPDGSSETIPGQLVLRSVGYVGRALPGVPFDAEANVIPTEASRVVGAGPGQYACGWISRGATGVIGTNRSDAAKAAAAVIEDATELLQRDVTPGSAVALLDERGVQHVSLAGWHAIDAAEIKLGEARQAARIKLSTREELLTAIDP